MHVVACDEFVGERVNLFGRELHALVLELHSVLDARELRGGDCVGAINVAIVERLTGNEGVDEIAVESVCDFLETFEADL